MSGERNRTHKRNRKKKEMQFLNNKATFVAGFTVMMMSINDIIGLISKIPMWVNWIEWSIVFFLYVFALCTKKMDKCLSTKGAENFGSFLTLFSIAEFLLGRALISSVEGIEFAWSLSNEVMLIVLVLSIFSVVGIVGALYLLFYKYQEK